MKAAVQHVSSGRGIKKTYEGEQFRTSTKNHWRQEMHRPCLYHSEVLRQSGDEWVISQGLNTRGFIDKNENQLCVRVKPLPCLCQRRQNSGVPEIKIQVSRDQRNGDQKTHQWKKHNSQETPIQIFIFYTCELLHCSYVFLRQ